MDDPGNGRKRGRVAMDLDITSTSTHEALDDDHLLASMTASQPSTYPNSHDLSPSKESCCDDINEEEEEDILKRYTHKNGQFSSCKRMDALSWDDYFMSIAFLSAQRSKDPNTQVGACIVNEFKQIVGMIYTPMNT